MDEQHENFLDDATTEFIRRDERVHHSENELQMHPRHAENQVSEYQQIAGKCARFFQKQKTDGSRESEHYRGFDREIQGPQASTSADTWRFARREAELRSEMEGMRLDNSRVKNDVTQSRREMMTAVSQGSETSSCDAVIERIRLHVEMGLFIFIWQKSLHFENGSKSRRT